jgi:hypothetical protein
LKEKFGMRPATKPPDKRFWGEPSKNYKKLEAYFRKNRVDGDGRMAVW